MPITTFVTLEKISMQLYSYFTREMNRGKLYHSVSDPKKRVQHALGLKKSTLNRWIRSNDTEEIHARKMQKRGPKPKFDSFDKDVMHRVISNYLQDSQVLTLRKLKHKLSSDHDINVSKVSLWRYVRGLGFTFKKLKGSKNVLCESSNIVSLRARYLRKLKEARESGYDIYFLDETYINAHHVFDKEWQSTDGTIKRKVPSGKGKRLIIAHCGSSERGLIPDGELIFESKSNDEHGDYHKDMCSTEFNKWIMNKVVPSFNKKSCLVMDNASYHNVLDDEDKIPTRKNEIKDWLSKSEIPFNDAMLRPELLQLAKANKKKKSFQIDKYLESEGHMCLRLPPYHPHLNPIELVWSEVKRSVALDNTTFKIKDIKQLATKAMSDINKDFWNKCEDHVKKIEENYWQQEGLHIKQNPVIIDLMDSSDSE